MNNAALSFCVQTAVWTLVFLALRNELRSIIVGSSGNSISLQRKCLFCGRQGSSLHGILQARILECVAISFSRGSSQPRDRTWDSCAVGGFLTMELLEKPSLSSGCFNHRPRIRGLTSRCAAGWEVLHQGGVLVCTFSLCPQSWRESSRVSHLLLQGTHPIMRTPPSYPHHFPKPHLQTPLTQGLGLQGTNGEVAQTSSPQHWQPVYQGSCAIVRFYQECPRIPISLHYPQHLSASILFYYTVLMGLRW